MLVTLLCMVDIEHPDDLISMLYGVYAYVLLTKHCCRPERFKLRYSVKRAITKIYHIHRVKTVATAFYQQFKFVVDIFWFSHVLVIVIHFPVQDSRKKVYGLVWATNTVPTSRLSCTER